MGDGKACRGDGDNGKCRVLFAERSKKSAAEEDFFNEGAQYNQNTSHCDLFGKR